MRAKMKLPQFMCSLIKSGVKTGVHKFVQYVEKYMAILQSYHPLGTYYFFVGKDCDQPLITRNQRAIEELLGFIPPHKIVTSNGMELRVSHHSTSCKPQNRFSLANVTQIIDKLESKGQTKRDGNDHEISGALAPAEEEQEEEDEKVDLLQLLLQNVNNGDCGGTMYDPTAMYVAVDAGDDESVMEKYRSSKLSGSGWMKLVSNHSSYEYIDLFKAKVQQRKSKYPMLFPNIMTNDHFAAPIMDWNVDNDNEGDHESRSSERKRDDELKRQIKDSAEELKAAVNASAEVLKSTGKKWWNQAKDKYVANRANMQRNQSVHTKQVVNPNCARIPPVSRPYGSSVISRQPGQPEYQFYAQRTPCNSQYDTKTQVAPMHRRTESAPIGNTNYRNWQNSTNHILHSQRLMCQQSKPSTSTNSVYPVLSKK